MPPSDEGGGPPNGGSEGEKVLVNRVCRYKSVAFRFSLPQSASLTAPSSEGAFGTLNDHLSDEKIQKALGK